jgi:alpha-glucuronidase
VSRYPNLVATVEERTRAGRGARSARAWLSILCGIMACLSLHAETGYDVWLRYAALDGEALREARANIPAVVVVSGDSELIASARDELIRGVRGMTGRTLRLEPRFPNDSAILLGTLTR